MLRMRHIFRTLTAAIAVAVLVCGSAHAEALVSTVTGNLVDIMGVGAIDAPVKFSTVNIGAQNVYHAGSNTCASPAIVIPQETTVYTDNFGNLPSGLTLPQCAFVDVTINRSQPQRVQIPAVNATVDLDTLLLAVTDPPALVSSIACTGCSSVINPPNGSVGTATITVNAGAGFPLTGNVSATGFLIQQLGQPGTNGDALVWGDNAVVNNLTVNGTFSLPGTISVANIVPAPPLNGDQSLGAFNGVLTGVINVMDQSGASNSLTTLSVGTNGTTSITATGIGATDFANLPGGYDWIAIPGAGPTPSVTTPTGLNLESMSTVAGPGSGTHNTTWQTGCSAVNPFASCASGGTSCTLSNNYMVEVGNTITIDGAGSAGGNLTTTVTAINSRGPITVAATISTTVSQADTSVGNCTTSRSYRARAIDGVVYGAMSAPTAPQTLTTSANAENWSNFDLFAMSTQPNAIAYACETCEGTNCGNTESNWKLYDVEVPTYSYADVTDLSFPYTDYLLPIGATEGQPKVSPGIIYCHNFGHSFGNDVNNGGTTLPAGAVNGIYLGKLTVVSANVGTISPAASQTGTFTLRHDIGPAINSAFVQATQSGNDYEASPVYLPAANTGTLPGYSLVTPVVYPPLSQGLRLDTGLTVVEGDSTQQACITGTRPGCYNALNWFGALGATAFSVINAGRPEINHLQLNGPVTMGVGVDIDEAASFPGVTTTGPNLQNSSIGCGSVPLRLSNVNTSNVEFGVDDQVYLGACTPPNNSNQDGQPDAALLINSINSLKHTGIQSQITGQLGILNIQGSFTFFGGQVCGNGDIGVWSPIYQSDRSVVGYTRNEYCSRMWYGGIEGASTENNAPDLIDNSFANIELPADGQFVLLTGSGSPKLDGNWFSTTMWGNNGVCSYPFPNTFISVLQGAFSTGTSENNWYDAMSYTTAFAALPTGFMSSTADYGSSSGSGCGFVPFVQPTVTPGALTLTNTNCPFTIPTETVGGYYTDASCAIGYAGGTLTFPVTDSPDSNIGCFTIAINSQATCKFDYSYNFNAGNLTFREMTNPASGSLVGCTTTANHYGTMNASVSGNSILVDNELQISGNLFPIFHAKSGACE